MVKKELVKKEETENNGLDENDAQNNTNQQS